jgi:hypothetical protein
MRGKERKGKERKAKEENRRLLFSGLGKKLYLPVGQSVSIMGLSTQFYQNPWDC